MPFYYFYFIKFLNLRVFTEVNRYLDSAFCEILANLSRGLRRSSGKVKFDQI